MKRILACCLYLVVSAAWAQAAPEPQASDLDAEEAACYQRFAVSGCLNDVRSKRRALQASLRRQEAAAHEREFAARAAEQRARSQQKVEERQHTDQERLRGNAASEQAQRLQAQQDKQASHLAQSQQAPASAAATPQATGPTAAEQAANRANFARKQADAEHRKEAIAKRAADKASVPLPLPLPR
jgi:hypothetical protein